jgi:hypothetical protein
VEDSVEAGDAFGAALAAGDFDNDSCDDLAVGVPGEDLSSYADAGLAQVFYGVSGGPTGSDDQLWHQDITDIDDVNDDDEVFGMMLIAGDVGTDGIDDLLVYLNESDSCSGLQGAGHSILGSSSTGLVATGDSMECVVDSPDEWEPRVCDIDSTCCLCTGTTFLAKATCKVKIALWKHHNGEGLPVPGRGICKTG